jgi:hypothetical protein
MALTLLPVPALAADGGLTVETYILNYFYNDPGSVTEKWIFANGTPITVKAKGSGSVITDAKGNELTPDGFTNGENGYDLSDVGIVGGKHGDLSGNTSVTVEGGTVGCIVGGCYGGTLTGAADVSISGGTLKSIPIGINYVSGHESLWSPHRFSLIGGSFAGNTDIAVPPSSAAVTGNVNVTISGGQLYGTQSIVGQGVRYKTGGLIKATTDKAFLTVTGGTFSITGMSFQNERICTDVLSDSIKSLFYGTATNGLFASITGSNTIEQNNILKDSKLFQFCTPGNTYYIMTDKQNDGNYAENSLTGSHYVIADDSTKTYSMSTSAQIFRNYTIPKGYTLTIPSGTTLTVPAGATVTNNGSIVIKGTLANNGTISPGADGSIVNEGGTYTAGSGAAPATVESVVSDFFSLTIAAGAARGTTKISAIDAADSGNQQFYKYVYSTSTEPVPPIAGSVLDTSGYTQLSSAPTSDLPVAVNGGYLIVCEVNSAGKCIKYRCTAMTTANVFAGTAYDPLNPSVVTQGDADNTSKISVTADSGNKLYYGVTDASVGANYAYNTPIDTGSLTAVTSGTDISAVSGKYLSVYEVNSDNLLRKFVCVPLTSSNFTAYTGGLVADRANHIIYCNGATVCMSAEQPTKSNISTPGLYVLDDGVWKAAVPKGLDFSNGIGFASYTLKGTAKADDTVEKGTLYLLNTDCPNLSNNVSTPFNRYLPKGVSGFANYIRPLLESENSKPYSEESNSNLADNYLVGGTIDLSSARLNHLTAYSTNTGGSNFSRELVVSSLTLAPDAKLTIPSKTDGSSILPSDSLKVSFINGKDSIKKGEGATITNLVCGIFQPKVDIKLLKSDGTEFAKANGVYQIPNNQQVTIVAAFGASTTAASVSSIPGVHSGAAKESGVFSGSAAPYLDTYALAFRESISDSSDSYHYFSGNDLTIFSSGSGEDKVTTVSLTLPDFKNYARMTLLASNQGVRDSESGSSYIPPRYLDSWTSQQYTVLTSAQAALNVSGIPANPTYGDSSFQLSVSGGSGSGALSYDSSNSAVATVDANGNVTINGAGSATLTVTKAGSNVYTAAVKTVELTVAKKAPASSDLTMTPPSNLTYDISGKAATVAVKGGLTGFGTVSKIYYTGVDGTSYAKSETAPINAGTYQVSVDLEAGDNYAAATGIDVGKFTIAKAANYAAPTALTADDTNNTLTFTPVPGASDYQYSTDGGATWKDCVDTDASTATVTIRVGNIAGTVQVRVKETANYIGQIATSDAFTATLEGSVSITGTAKLGETLTANVTGAQKDAVFTYQWKAAGTDISGATGKTYTSTIDRIGKTITVVVSAAPYVGTLTSAATAAVAKGDPTGTPAYKTVSASGKKLADAALAIGTLVPNAEGYQLIWVDAGGKPLADTTEIKANASYKWLFTPADTVHYSALSGSVTLYPVGSSSVTVAETPKVDTKTNAVILTVNGSNVSESQLKAATETAAKAGVTAVTLTNSTGDSFSMTGAALGQIASTSCTLTLDTQSGGTVSLTPAVLKGLNLKTTDDVSIGMTGGAAADGVQHFSVDVTVNKAAVHDLNGAVALSFPVKADWNGKLAVVSHLHANGTTTYSAATIQNSLAGITVTDLSDFTVQLASDLKATAFSDVQISDWCFGSIEYAVEHGLFAGTSAATFAPNATMTRQQMWMVLARSAGKTPATMADARNWAVTGKISDGSNGASAVTREQFVTLLWRAAGSPAATKDMSCYTDFAGVAGYAKTAMTWAVNNGILSGTSDTTLGAKDRATRAQIAVILTRYIHQKSN